MGARLTDSAAYAHLWGTDETRALFDEPARWQRWLDILVALAEAQAELGIIPHVVRRVDRRPGPRRATSTSTSSPRRRGARPTRRSG